MVYAYTATGRLSGYTDSASGSSLLSIGAMDASGRVTQYSQGAVSVTRKYDGLERLTASTTSNAALQADTYGYDPVGNVSARSWNDAGGTARSESFGYDERDRVSSVSGASKHSYTYDDLGDLATKDGVGYYYSANSHRLTSIGGTVNGVWYPSFATDADGNITAGAGLTTAWTSFNMPATITRGNVTDTFKYGPEHQRVLQQRTGGASTYYCSVPLISGINYACQCGVLGTEIPQ